MCELGPSSDVDGVRREMSAAFWARYTQRLTKLGFQGPLKGKRQLFELSNELRNATLETIKYGLTKNYFTSLVKKSFENLDEMSKADDFEAGFSDKRSKIVKMLRSFPHTLTPQDIDNLTVSNIVGQCKHSASLHLAVSLLKTDLRV